MSVKALPSTGVGPVHCRLVGVRQALGEGWRVLRRAPQISLAYGGVFALLGTLAVWGMQWLRLAPLTLPLFGGFLLVGPVVLAGLTGVAEAVRADRSPDFACVVTAWRATPRGVWALASFCVLVFFIAAGDIGTLYSFLVGQPVEGLAKVLPTAGWLSFHLSAAVSGGFLAAVVFVVTVHAVPLLHARRASLVGAVVDSVRANFASPLAHMAWAAVLAVCVFSMILAPPLLAVVLPWLAYAGAAFHRAVFPPEAAGAAVTDATLVRLRGRLDG